MQDHSKEEFKVPKSHHNSVRSQGPLPSINEDRQTSAHEQASQNALPCPLADLYLRQQNEINELRGTIKHLEQRHDKHVNNFEAHIQQQELENSQLKDMIKRLEQSHDKHVNNLEAHIQQQKLENSQLKDTIKHLEQHHEKHVNNLEAHIQQQKLENSQLKDTIKCLEQRLGEHDKHVNNLEAHHQRQEIESGILRVSVETYLEALTIRMNPQEHYLSNGFYLWKIENYEQSRQDAISGVKTDKFSPSICTSRYGYRLRLRICLNGVDSGLGRNIALFVQMVKGDYDDFLEWPFTGKITLSILDQSEGLAFRQHISKTVIATRNLLAFQKPIAGYNSACEGHEEMAPIKDILDPQYIKNNTMLVCIYIEP